MATTTIASTQGAVHGPRRRASWSSRSSPSTPSGIVGSIDLPPEHEPGRAAHPQPRRPTTCPSGSRPGPRSTGSSGRTPRPTGCRRRQLAALRGWLAGGGRLVIAGGTIGPAALAAFPDAMLPYRPVVTTDVPAGGPDRPARRAPDGRDDRAGPVGRAHRTAATLATAGDRVVAAERPYGSGSVTLLGFDPSVDWIAKTDAAQDLWRRLLPATDVRRPVVLRRQPAGRRGLAAAGAGAAADRRADPHPARLHPAHRADQLLRPASGSTAASGRGSRCPPSSSSSRSARTASVPPCAAATSSSTRWPSSAARRARPTARRRSTSASSRRRAASTRSSVPGGALLSAPISGDFFGTTGTANTLDVLQGDPARVRDLGVGFSSLRAIRAETAVERPADRDRPAPRGRPAQGHGQERLAASGSSDRPSSSARPSWSSTTSSPARPRRSTRRRRSVQFGQSLSDKVVGAGVFGDVGRDERRRRGSTSATTWSTS